MRGNLASSTRSRASGKILDYAAANRRALLYWGSAGKSTIGRGAYGAYVSTMAARLNGKSGNSSNSIASGQTRNGVSVSKIAPSGSHLGAIGTVRSKSSSIGSISVTFCGRTLPEYTSELWNLMRA